MSSAVVLVVVVIRTEDKPRAAFRLFRTMEKAGTTFDGHHNRKRTARGFDSNNVPSARKAQRETWGLIRIQKQREPARVNRFPLLLALRHKKTREPFNRFRPMVPA